MKVTVGDFEAGDDEADSFAGENLFEGSCKQTCSAEKVTAHRGFEIGPLVDLCHRTQQQVSICDWVDGEERSTEVISVDECSWNLAGKNSSEY